MFTSGMKESSAQQIELKGVTATGLQKLIEIVYTSSTTFDSHSDLFEAISCASHLQCLLALDYCEKSLLKRLTCRNFSHFIQMAKMYRLQNALKQIDLFIANNLAQIINQSGWHKRHKKHQLSHSQEDPDRDRDQDQDAQLPPHTHSDIVGSANLTYHQMAKCLSNNELRMREIDLFVLAWQWIVNNNLAAPNASKALLNERVRISEHKYKRKICIIRSLMKNIRFGLINPSDLVKKVQSAHSLVLSDKCIRQMVLDALNYHLMGVTSHCQHFKIRSPVTSLMMIGGREITPNPNIHDSCYLLNSVLTETHSFKMRKSPLTSLPNNLSHMQCVLVNNVLYMIGGCLSQCAHGESAVSATYKYEPSLNKWTYVAQMVEKRAYFYACALHTHSKQWVYAFGGKNRDGSLCSIEKFSADNSKWSLCKSLPSTCYAHAGAVLNDTAYICGGYTDGQFSASLYSFSALSDQLEELAGMNVARGWHSVCAVADTLFVFGGCFLNAQAQSLQLAEPTNVAECYSVQTNQWSVLKPMVNLHKEASAVHINRSVYIFGGYNIAAKTGQKLVSRYDLESGEWHTAGQLAAGMTGVGCVVIDLPWYLVHKQEAKCVSSSSCLSHLADDVSDEDEEESTGTSSDEDEFSIYTNSESDSEEENCFKTSQRNSLTQNL
ncbi:kelch 9 [Brachionus plicatilis]|uniref:Kelch 9 n=1 Tax=Brachionus plicatilis TaxID=10195 RepID=A0A3M7RR33_BRAPC|nr:kelch 9 [Brachionus plicatilis]